MKFKNDQAVLIIIYTESTNRVLMLQRKDDSEFWQSVTGTLDDGETPQQAAVREVKEETGIDIITERLNLIDCNESVVFEIFPHFRYKYAPNVTHCREHWFLLAVKQEFEPILSERLAYRWLEAKQAAELTKSPNNAKAIEKYLTASFFRQEGKAITTN